MKEAKVLTHVAEFHRTFQHPIKNEPEIPQKQRCALRISLLSEELKELEKAIEEQDIVEIADALGDLQYVLGGAILEFGLGNKFHLLFDEIQRSNMTKACSTKEEAEASVDYYKKREEVECFYEKVDDKFLLFRKSDHKVLKSILYSPANLKAILENNK